MKKLFLTISLLLFGILTMAQAPFTGWYVATPTTQFGRTVDIGQFIFVQSTGGIYQIIKKSEGSSATITSVKALGVLYYKDFSPGIGGTISPTTVTVTTAVNPSVTGAGTLGTTGLRWATEWVNILYAAGHALSKTSANANSLDLAASLSLASGDTLSAPKVKSPYVWCTGADGGIFTATNGTYWKLQLTSAGTASYVAVTP